MNSLQQYEERVFEVSLPGRKEYFIAASAAQDETASSVLSRTLNRVRECNAQIVAAEMFGAAPGARESELLAAHGGGTEWPVAWIGEEQARGIPLSGVQLWAVDGVPCERVRLGGRVVGTVFEDADARYCRLAGVLPEAPAEDPGTQTAQVFSHMSQALEQAGMNFGHVVRTWFFNDKITSWYRAFNDARDDFFYAHHVFDGLVPASTGIGGSNSTRAALTAGLLAVEPKSGTTEIRRVSSPLQCPAFDYGSSFSRAVEVEACGCRRILVSGTASIAPEGHTLHLDEPEPQMEQTLQVVEAILHAREMDWPDVNRAILYFKRTQDMPLFEKFVTKLARAPVVWVNNDVCRHDLLFEIELDAIKTT